MKYAFLGFSDLIELDVLFNETNEYLVGNELTLQIQVRPLFVIFDQNFHLLILSARIARTLQSQDAR